MNLFNEYIKYQRKIKEIGKIRECIIYIYEIIKIFKINFKRNVN